MQQPINETPLVETKVEDGKLLYERRWFHRGQSVYVEGRDLPRFAANISAINNEVVGTRSFFICKCINLFYFFMYEVYLYKSIGLVRK